MDKIIKYITNTENRLNVFKSLAHVAKTPSEISHLTDIKTSQVSGILSVLSSTCTITLFNPWVRSGRLYGLTMFGAEIYKFLKLTTTLHG